MCLNNHIQEKYVTPQWIQQFKSIVHSAPVMMVDANLSPEALKASCRSKYTFLLCNYSD